MRLENIDEAHLKLLAQKIADQINGQEVILLDGELGSGKTTFCRFLVTALGGNEVASPTYSLHNRYIVDKKMTIDHFDLYRIESDHDLETTGFFELLYTANLMIIEWSSKLNKNEIPLHKKVIEVTIGKYINSHDQLRWVEVEGVSI